MKVKFVFIKSKKILIKRYGQSKGYQDILTIGAAFLPFVESKSNPECLAL
jgi:hypothetical protein